MEKTRITSALGMLLMLWPVPSLAQQLELGIGEQRPWALHVPLENQHAARQAFLAGNEQLKNGFFANAAESYQQALKSWRHPAIHYNLALALLPLNEPLEVHENLTEALRYAGEPLDPDKRERAKQLKVTMEQQLTRLEIICDVPPGASVRMGEEPLCVTSTRSAEWVLPREVTFTATHEDRPDHLWRRTLHKGEAVTVRLKMYTEDELTYSKRLWPAWRPWAVLGAGAAIAVSGGWLYTQAHGHHQRFDDGIRVCRGCVPTPALLAERTRGDNLQKLASGAYAASGAALITGLVLLYANRPQSRVLTPDEHEQQLNIAPLAGSQRGVVMTVHY